VVGKLAPAIAIVAAALTLRHWRQRQSGTVRRSGALAAIQFAPGVQSVVLGVGPDRRRSRTAARALTPHHVKFSIV